MPSEVLRRLAGLSGRGALNEVRAALSEDNYGVDWSLTEVVQLRGDGELIRRALCGVMGARLVADPQHRLNMRVALRTVSGKVEELRAVRPSGDAPVHMTDESGVAHHLPGQWVPQVVRRYNPTFDLSVSSDDCYESALWLLGEHGWRGRNGGGDRYRFDEADLRRHRRDVSQPVLIDLWRFVEVAYEKRFPDLAPTDKDRAERVIKLGAPTLPPPGFSAGQTAELQRQLAELQAQVTELTAGRGKGAKSSGAPTP